MRTVFFSNNNTNTLGGTNMSIPLMRYKRHKILTDTSSPELNYLKPVPGHSRTYSLDDVAAETEAIGGMSAEDVSHVMKSFVRSLRKILTRGDKVKIEHMGTFFTTYTCEGTEEEKDCTVRNIKRINVRFAVDNTLRLVNDSIATTRGAANNVEFYIKSDVKAGSNNNPGGTGGDDDDDYVDPNA